VNALLITLAFIAWILRHKAILSASAWTACPSGNVSPLERQRLSRKHPTIGERVILCAISTFSAGRNARVLHLKRL